MPVHRNWRSRRSPSNWRSRSTASSPEGGLYDRELAALAIKQAWGDLIEAAFLVRAYRTTLPRLYDSLPVDTGAMDPDRRISAISKDIPGGQMIGPTFDYTQRLLDFTLLASNGAVAAPQAPADDEAMPSIMQLLVDEGLLAPGERGPNEPVADVTREPLALPAGRAARLQSLARADEGFVLGLAYSTQRGYGRTHPFAGEIRVGAVEVTVEIEELGFAVTIAEITMTEVQTVNQFTAGAGEPARFTRGYGLTLGYNERKTMAMALVERAMRAEEFGERRNGPAQDPEFVLLHADSVEAQGFVQHLKLPHYVDFQAELNLVRTLRREAAT